MKNSFVSHEQGLSEANGTSIRLSFSGCPEKETQIPIRNLHLSSVFGKYPGPLMRLQENVYTNARFGSTAVKREIIPSVPDCIAKPPRIMTAFSLLL